LLVSGYSTTIILPKYIIKYVKSTKPFNSIAYIYVHVKGDFYVYVYYKRINMCLTENPSNFGIFKYQPINPYIYRNSNINIQYEHSLYI